MALVISNHGYPYAVIGVFYGVETCSLRLPIAEQAKYDALQEAAGCKPALHIGGRLE